MQTWIRIAVAAGVLGLMLVAGCTNDDGSPEEDETSSSPYSGGISASAGGGSAPGWGWMGAVASLALVGLFQARRPKAK